MRKRKTKAQQVSLLLSWLEWSSSPLPLAAIRVSRVNEQPTAAASTPRRAASNGRRCCAAHARLCWRYGLWPQPFGDECTRRLCTCGRSHGTATTPACSRPTAPSSEPVCCTNDAGNASARYGHATTRAAAALGIAIWCRRHGNARHAAATTPNKSTAPAPRHRIKR